MLKKWMNAPETSKHEVFSMDILLSALTDHDSELANELAFYKRIKDYVKKYKKDKKDMKESKTNLEFSQKSGTRSKMEALEIGNPTEFNPPYESCLNKMISLF